MKGLIRFINSSVGKKLLMSLTGLFLCSFLVVHLVGNLQLMKSDEAFNQYAEFMATNPLIRIIEVGLFLGLLLHGFNGVYLWFMNRSARSQKYKVYKLSDNTEFAARILAISASIVFIFLVLHLYQFFVPHRLATPTETMAVSVKESFKDINIVVFYIFGFLLLGYHLKHGFQSAFQTLGWRNKKLLGLIETIAAFFWLIVPLGYAIIPIYFYWIARAAGLAAGGN